MTDLTPVRVGGHIVAYKPAEKKAAKKTTANKAEDKQAETTATNQKES